MKGASILFMLFISHSSRQPEAKSENHPQPDFLSMLSSRYWYSILLWHRCKHQIDSLRDLQSGSAAARRHIEEALPEPSGAPASC